MLWLYIATHGSGKVDPPTHTHYPQHGKKLTPQRGGGGMGSTICLVYGTLGEVFFDVWEMGGEVN